MQGKETKFVQECSWIISGKETLRRPGYRREDTKMRFKETRLEGMDFTVYLPLCVGKWWAFVKTGMKCRGTKCLY
jgi:hypothetical protein